jgi:hypothetical protein
MNELQWRAGENSLCRSNVSASLTPWRRRRESMVRPTWVASRQTLRNRAAEQTLDAGRYTASKPKGLTRLFRIANIAETVFGFLAGMALLMTGDTSAGAGVWSSPRRSLGGALADVCLARAYDPPTQFDRGAAPSSALQPAGCGRHSSRRRVRSGMGRAAEQGGGQLDHCRTADGSARAVEPIAPTLASTAQLAPS